jgi:hypothetical protein
MGKEDACACVCSAFALHNETVRSSVAHGHELVRGTCLWCLTHAHTHTLSHAHTAQVNIWTHGLAFLMFGGLVIENLISTAAMPFSDRYDTRHSHATQRNATQRNAGV